MYYKADVPTINGIIHFEFEQFPEVTIVALDAKLDDFKGIPVKDNTGREGLHFVERTMKDFSKLDGVIYLHKGRVSDRIICEKIEIFQKALQNKKLWSVATPGLITSLK